MSKVKKILKPKTDEEISNDLSKMNLIDQFESIMQYEISTKGYFELDTIEKRFCGKLKFEMQSFFEEPIIVDHKGFSHRMQGIQQTVVITASAKDGTEIQLKIEGGQCETVYKTQWYKTSDTNNFHLLQTIRF